MFLAPRGQEDANFNGSFGWRESVQPVIDKALAGQTMNLRIGAQSSTNAEVVFEELYFLTKEEYNKLVPPEEQFEIKEELTLTKNSIKDAAWMEKAVMRTDNGLKYSVGENGITMTPSVWGNLVFKCTPQKGAYALKVKVSAQQPKCTFSIMFDEKNGCQYISQYHGSDKPLHGDGDPDQAPAGTYESYLILVPRDKENEDNWNGLFGWKADVQPIADKIAKSQEIRITLGAVSRANSTIVFEEFYFITRAEYDALQK